jgi:hypothetical protein
MKYIADCWSDAGKWLALKDTLEEAKNVWCYGMIVYEVPEDQLDVIKSKFSSYDEASKYVKANFTVVYDNHTT